MPAGFSDTVLISGLTNPTAVQFAADGRIFVAEKNGRHQGLRRVDGHDADGVRRPPSRGRRLLGPGPARPGARTRTSRPTRTCTSCTPTTRRSAARRRRGTTAARRRPGRRPTAASSAGGCRRLTAAGDAVTGTEQVLINDWCQQFPSHRSGRSRFGPDGYALRERRRRRELQLRRLRASSAAPTPATGQPVRRSAAGVGTALTPADRRGRRAAQPGRAHDRRPGDARRRDHPRRPRHRAPASPGNPFAGSTDANARADHRLRPAQPVPVHRPARARTSCGSATSAGTRGRRSTASPTPTTAPSTNFGWPCYEGKPAAVRATRPPTCTMCESLYSTAGPVTAPVLRLQPRQPGRVRGDVPDRRLVDHRHGVLHRRHLPGELHGGAVLRRPHAATASGHAGRRQRRSRIRARPGVRRRGRQPGRPRDRPGGDLFYVDLDGGTIHRIRYTAANQPPVAVASPRSRPPGPTPLTVSSTAAARATPKATR